MAALLHNPYERGSEQRVLNACFREKQTQSFDSFKVKYTLVGESIEWRISGSCIAWKGFFFSPDCLQLKVGMTYPQHTSYENAAPRLGCERNDALVPA